MCMNIHCAYAMYMIATFYSMVVSSVFSDIWCTRRHCHLHIWAGRIWEHNDNMRVCQGNQSTGVYCGLQKWTNYEEDHNLEVRGTQSDGSIRYLVPSTWWWIWSDGIWPGLWWWHCGHELWTCPQSLLVPSTYCSVFDATYCSVFDATDYTTYSQ